MLKVNKNRPFIRVTIVLVIIFTGFNSLSCDKTIDDNLRGNIISLIAPDNSFKTYVTIIISDTDCTSCYKRISNYEKSKKIVYKGFFLSRNPSAFKLKLEKVNPSVEWINLNNDLIITKIRNRYPNLNGPYEFYFIDGILYLNNEIVT